MGEGREKVRGGVERGRERMGARRKKVERGEIKKSVYRWVGTVHANLEHNFMSGIIILLEAVALSSAINKLIRYTV